MAENEKKQGRISKFFGNLKSELKKVTWPSKTDTRKNSTVVVVELILCGIFIGILDVGFNKLITLLASI